MTLTFLLLLVFTFIVVFLLLRPTKAESAIQQHLEDIQEGRELVEEGPSILRKEEYSSNPDLSRIVREIPGAVGTLNLIRQAGQDWSVASVLGVVFLAALFATGLSSLFVSGIFLPVCAGAAVGSIPYIYLLVLREQRFRACDRLLPEAVDLMARGLRAGHALNAVLEMVGNEIAEPLATEFKRLHEEHSLGLTLRDATMNVVHRLPRDDMRFLATAILIQKETGGNLAVILDKAANVARERARLRGQLRIYTAQGRITGWVLCLMPFVMFGLLSWVNWEYEGLLIREEMGRHAVYGALIMMVLGILAIRKIVDVKV